MAKVCEDYKEWIEEEVETPLQERVEETVEKCKERPCKKWCLCCNKWFCWLEVVVYWVTRWIVTIVGKWLVYVICRIVSVLFTLGLTILNILGWPLKYLWCIFGGGLPMRPLQVEVVIVDQSRDEANPATEDDIDARLAHADRILRSAARISVKRHGDTRRMVSPALWEIDSSSFVSNVGEFLKGIGLLLGRNDARHLTVYAVGIIKGAEGVHLPFYGSVFLGPNTPDTTLAHELGHALLSFGNAYHSSISGALMFTPPDQRETAANWPTDLPTLSHNEKCTMRRSRWLDWSWVFFIP